MSEHACVWLNGQLSQCMSNLDEGKCVPGKSCGRYCNHLRDIHHTWGFRRCAAALHTMLCRIQCLQHHFSHARIHASISLLSQEVIIIIGIIACCPVGCAGPAWTHLAAATRLSACFLLYILQAVVNITIGIIIALCLVGMLGLPGHIWLQPYYDHHQIIILH